MPHNTLFSHTLTTRFSATARLGLMLAVAFTFSVSASAYNQTVYVTSFGAWTDGSHTAETTAAFQQAFSQAWPSGKIVLSAGYYSLDNSNGGFQTYNFNGEIAAEGDAQILFAANSQPGLVFVGGWGTRVRGLHLVYPTPPSANTGAAAIWFNSTVNARVSDIIVQGSPDMGIHFQNALEPKLINASVLNTIGDGVRFENSRNSEAANISVQSAGGNGVNFLTIAGTADRNGAMASNLTVSTSSVGVAVTGTSQVTLSGVYVESSANSGIYCGSGGNGALPDDVTFQGGIVSNAGGYGIQIDASTHCSVATYQVLNPGLNGVSASAPQGSIEIRNVRVTGNRNSDAFAIFNTMQAIVSDCSAENGTGYGFFFDTVSRVIASGLTTMNVSRNNPLRRAVWFQNVNSLVASNLSIGDNQSPPTGYIVGTASVAHGSIQNVASGVMFGNMVVQNLANLFLAQIN
jgi:hypothetical protein